jgi:phage shock protein A
MPGKTKVGRSYFNKYLKKSETENAKTVEQHIQKMISLYESLTQSNKKATADESINISQGFFVYC